jgi:hypothetical protein
MARAHFCLTLSASFALALLACKTEPALEVAPKDPLASCASKVSNQAVTWKCPNEVVALDMQAKIHHEKDEVTLNLEKFAEPFLVMGAKRDDAEFVVGAARYRSARFWGEKPGAGPFFSQMVVVDAAPTRYVSCAARIDACDPILRGLLTRDAGAP